ncbi:MAG TPA: hypothetical protein VIC33_06890 [Vicinamibacterales bacterium]|jgi:hypothetical protein
MREELIQCVRRAAVALLLLGGMAGAAACASSPEAPSNAAAALIPPGGLTFSRDIQPILSTRCVGCHKASHLTAGVDLSSYAGVMREVTPGSPSSVLIQVTQPDGVMYIALGADPSQKAAEIRSWIVDNHAAP